MGAAGGYALPPVSVHDYFGIAKYDFTHLDTQIATLVVDHHFDANLSLRETLRLANYKRSMEATISQSITDLDGKPITAATPLDDILAVRNHSKSRDNDDNSILSQTELTWRVQTGAVRHTLLGGVELGQEKFDRWNYTWTNALSSTPYLNPDPWTEVEYTRTPNSRTRTKADTAAAYLQDQLAFPDQLKAVAGLVQPVG